jgi:ABC-type uncharacterized transport system ATPase subunit
MYMIIFPTHCCLCAAQVLLLDEVTVDLDVVARMDLLQFFVQECNQVRPLCLLWADFCNSFTVRIA